MLHAEWIICGFRTQKHYKRKNDNGTAYVEINDLAFEVSIRDKSGLNNNAL